MNVQQLLDAVSTLQEVGEAFSNMPEEEKESTIASLHMTAANLYLIQLAKHLQDGVEPYDAVLMVAKGDTPLTDLGVTEEQMTVFRLLTTKATKE
jgi:hypothetical protein